jgi:excisionase family DNA binding protein
MTDSASPEEGMGMNYLTAKQVAERLQVSSKVIYQLCSERKIAHIRIGTGRGTIRITEAALQEFLEGCEVKRYSVPAHLRHIRASGSLQ